MQRFIYPEKKVENTKCTVQHELKIHVENQTKIIISSRRRSFNQYFFILRTCIYCTTSLHHLFLFNSFSLDNTVSKVVRMSGGSDFKAKRKQKPTVLPIWLPRSINLNSGSLTFKDFIPIIVLIYVLNLVVTGEFIPKFITWLISLFISPGTTILSRPEAPKSISAFTDSKYLGNFKPHGLTSGKSVISEKNKYIFPPVQEASDLKELGYENLFDLDTSVENSKRKKYKYSAEFYNDIIEKDSKKKDKKTKIEDSQGIESYKNVITNFRLQGRRMYNGNENPEIVLVTGINYEKLDPALLIKIIQNRVDYAHIHNFGVYSRWVQEFIPLLQTSRNDLDNWAKPMIIREAMNAFPNAKWFWYIDETSLIMNDAININDYILKDETLEPILLRDQPILPPDGVIKTYKNVKPDHLSLIITQTDSGLDTNNFLIKNNLGGKALLDIWKDPKMRMYTAFRKDITKALSHILQWHSELLFRTGVIPPRTINSIAIDSSTSINKELLYRKGDFVISHPNCKVLGNCDEKMIPYWRETQAKGSK